MAGQPDLGVSVVVLPDLAKLAEKLKKYSDKGGKSLKNQMAKEMRTLGDRVLKAEKDAVMRLSIKGVGKASGKTRHRRGGRSTGSGKGIRGPVAASIQRKNLLSGNKVGLEIRASRKALPYGMKRMAIHLEEGGWRHPVFGDRENWVAQRAMPAGFFTRTRDEMAPVVQRELVKIANKYWNEAASLGA